MIASPSAHNQYVTVTRCRGVILSTEKPETVGGLQEPPTPGIHAKEQPLTMAFSTHAVSIHPSI